MSEVEAESGPVFRMVSRDGCPFCVAARRWFKDRGIACPDRIINDVTERNRFYDEEGLVGGERTVPQIYMDDKRIGGFTEFSRSEFAASKPILF